MFKKLSRRQRCKIIKMRYYCLRRSIHFRKLRIQKIKKIIAFKHRHHLRRVKRFKKKKPTYVLPVTKASTSTTTKTTTTTTNENVNKVTNTKKNSSSRSLVSIAVLIISLIIIM